MSLAVNTNVSSLTAHRSLAKNETMMSQAMTRLSTGLKINSASDDAAGLAIVERMTSQVKGLNMAVKNANDGIGLTKSIEGALVELTDMLQRLRELAIQSANDTNSSTDRRYIADEVALLKAEITRVSSNTRYNGSKVLDGTFLSQQLQIGTEGGEVIDVSVTSVAADQIGAYKRVDTANPAVALANSGASANTVTTTEIVTINGNTESVTLTAPSNGDSAKAHATAINEQTGVTGVTAVAKTYAKILTTNAGNEVISLNIRGKGTGNFTWNATNVADAVTKINDISGTTGVTAKASANNTFVILYHSTGEDIVIDNTAANVNIDVYSMDHDGTTANGTKRDLATSTGTSETRVMGTIELSSSESFSVVCAGDPTKSYFANGAGELKTVSGISLKTQTGASTAISVLDGAIEKVSSMRADLGAIENRLEHTVSNLMNVSEQTEHSRSLLQDADFAVESSNLSKAQVLMQAATAMLAQANARPQLALQLLQG